MYRRALTAVATLALATAVPALSGSAGAAPPGKAADESATPSGSFALDGEAALRFELPGDVVEVHRSVLADGTVSTRYQQKVGRARVLNGQITVVQHPDGQRTVIGAYYPGLTRAKEKKLTAGEATGVARARRGAAANESSRLRIDPRNGRLFYEVDQIRNAARYVTWVDARTGKVLKSYDAITEGESLGRGRGVKRDLKTFPTTRAPGAEFFLLANDDGNGPDTLGDNRRTTENARNRFKYRGNVLRDPDNRWLTTRPRYVNPDQRPGVDAHYYAGVVDSYFTEVFGRNSIDDEGMEIRSTVHFGKEYCNAFWNGEQMTYGDGDGRTCLPLSGGLDVVGHELTHGVTDFSSNLIYEDESGALNEAFSDMLGNSIEFYAEAGGLDPAAEPDWRIGEDVIPESNGFRNMGDPQEFGDPDHYAERYTGEEDNGGVHINSGIPNHAYYLLVNGGRNAGCAGSVSDHSHTRGCTFEVDAIGLEAAEQIFYTAFTGLTEYANMCDARNATVALGGYLGHARDVAAAWGAVGVVKGCTGGVPPPPPCVGDRTAELPFGARDYGNNADCTWVYDNGEPRFQLGFSLLDTEEGYDYVYVKDADGDVLDTYTGTYDTPVWSSCIPTSTGQVQLVSDASVKAEGFMVTEVRPC